MIKIKITKDDQVKRITVSGHAMYGEFGQDIVCASVSSIVITSVNAILSLDEDSISYTEDEGFVQIDVIKNNDIVNSLINNMINLLEQLVNKYPKNIKFVK